MYTFSEIVVYFFLFSVSAVLISLEVTLVCLVLRTFSGFWLVKSFRNGNNNDTDDRDDGNSEKTARCGHL